jgi:hypothetical protein
VVASSITVSSRYKVKKERFGTQIFRNMESVEDILCSIPETVIRPYKIGQPEKS